MTDDDHPIIPINTEEAAALCNMTIPAFRQALSRNQELRAAKSERASSPRHLIFDRDKVIKWHKERKKYKRRK